MADKKSKSGLQTYPTVKLDGGIKYKGKLENGVPHSSKNEKFIMEWPNGDRFEGIFKNGKREGHGKRINADGSQYEGNYKED